MTSKNQHNKIPLPWVEEEEDLKAKQTLEFWNLSRSWNGVTNTNHTVGDIISLCGDLLEQEAIPVPLTARVLNLRDDVVRFGTKKSKLKHEREIQRASKTPHKQTRLAVF